MDEDCETLDELDFVDEDIKKAFEGKSYFIGTPSIAQLTRNIKELINIISKPKEYEYKIIHKYGAEWVKMSDEDIELLKNGWELIYMEIDPKKQIYSIQMKKEI